MTDVVLHFSPHPDDELIGAPATLMALRDAGHRIVNVACGLGRPSQWERREKELREACRRAGFELLIPAEPVDISADCDPDLARAGLSALVGDALGAYAPRIVVSPGADDLHHGHGLVADAVREALEAPRPEPPRWWTWGIWGALPRPTLGTRFDGRRLEQILDALSAHVGELARNDYRRLVRARAEMNGSMAAELLFGFGSSNRQDARYAELLTELVRVGPRWAPGTPRWLDPSDPLGRESPDLADPGQRG